MKTRLLSIFLCSCALMAQQVTIPRTGASAAPPSGAASGALAGTYPAPTLSYNAVNAQTGTSYAILTGDRNKLVTLTNANPIAVSIAVATGAGFPSGWSTTVLNSGVGTATITPATSTIEGNATLTLLTGQSAFIWSNATNYRAIKSRNSLVSADIPNNAADTSGKATTAGNADTVTNGVTAAAVLGDTKVVVASGGAKGVAESALTASVTKMTSGVPSAATATDVSAPVFCSDAGANDTYACDPVPDPVAYVTGTKYRFKANTANTGAASINFHAIGALTIVKMVGGITTALADNDIRVGQWVEGVYDGTNFQMTSQLGNEPPTAGALSATLTEARFPALDGDVTTSAGDLTTAVAATISKWRTYTYSYTNAAFKVASTTAAITVQALPANVAIHGVGLNTTTAFIGTLGPITTATCVIGDATTADKYTTAATYDLIAAVADGNLYVNFGSLVAKKAAHNAVLTCTADVNWGHSATAISAATNAAAAVLTSVAHGLTNGASVTISGATGDWTPINGTFTISDRDADTFSIPVDSTAFGALAGSPVMAATRLTAGALTVDLNYATKH